MPKHRGGLLVINKPSGLTSFQVVKAARKILREKKVGHCGTLDPMATGVLLVLFGEATVHSGALMSGTKVYCAEMKLGLKTDTGDITGKILQTGNVPPLTVQSVESAFRSFTGEIEQKPPMYSAVKHKGRKLYDYARDGIEIDRQPRKVTVFSLSLIELQIFLIRFRLECSKGTYVRSLVEDIGDFLGVPATLSGLERERSGQFSIRSSIAWEEFKGMNRRELLNRSLAIGDLVPK
jgi:tRNA pseudouridine55 synthase